MIMENRRDFINGLFEFIVIDLLFLAIFIYALLRIIISLRNCFRVVDCGSYGLCLVNFRGRCVKRRLDLGHNNLIILYLCFNRSMMAVYAF